MNIDRSVSKSKLIFICTVLSLILITKLLWRFYKCQISQFLPINYDNLWGLLIVSYLTFLAICFWPYIWSIPEFVDTPYKKVSIGINTLIFNGLISSLFWLPGWFIIFAIGFGYPKFSIYLQFLLTLIILNIYFWKKIPRQDRKIAFIPWMISILCCFTILLSYIPHTTPENFQNRATDFEAVVAMIDKGELKPDQYGYIDVPCRYKYLSKSINVKLEKDTTVINFLQITAGLGDVANFITYRSDNLQPMSESNTQAELVKLKPHWFWQLIYF